MTTPPPLPANVSPIRPEARPTPPPALPPPAPPIHIDTPEWLNVDAKRQFRALVAAVNSLWPGSLTAADVPALALAAEHYTIAAAAAQAMRSRGNKAAPATTDKAHATESRKAPTYAILKQATGEYLKLAREFGLTPAARVRLNLDTSRSPTGGHDAEDENEDDGIFDA